MGGQDGILLTRLLKGKGYTLYGTLSPSTSEGRIREIAESGVSVLDCDLTDFSSVRQIISSAKPDEIYHLASDVQPIAIRGNEQRSYDINFQPGLNILNVVTQQQLAAKIYVAGSSLMFGNVTESSQNESTPMRPSTPYGIAKTALFNFINMYRVLYGTFACMGILYNHESPIRSDRFLPRKISKAVAQIKYGKRDTLVLGDLSAKRDWCYAGDVVKSMWLMLQNSQPIDYVVGSGSVHSVCDVLDVAFSFADLDWHRHVVIDDQFIRDIDYGRLRADPRKIERDLGWKADVHFRELIEMMVAEDLRSELDD